MAHKSIPAAHPMIALFGAAEIRCTKYAPIGTKDLADLAVEALGRGPRGAARQLRGGDDRRHARRRRSSAPSSSRRWRGSTPIALTVGRPRVLADEEAFRIGERLKTSGADIEARIAAFAAETAKPAEGEAQGQGRRRARPPRRSAWRGSGRREGCGRPRSSALRGHPNPSPVTAAAAPKIKGGGPFLGPAALLAEPGISCLAAIPGGRLDVQAEAGPRFSPSQRPAR